MIIFISHKLNEVKALCNCMTILRRKDYGNIRDSDLDEQEISLPDGRPRCQPEY